MVIHAGSGNIACNRRALFKKASMAMIRFETPKEESQEKILDIKSREIEAYFNDLYDHTFENGIKLDEKFMKSLK